MSNVPIWLLIVGAGFLVAALFIVGLIWHCGELPDEQEEDRYDDF